MRELEFFVYVMTNKTRSVLYIGVTNHLARRVWEHREGETPGFTQRYRVNRLVYYEQFRYALDAIAREKEIKKWNREKKNQLVVTTNPEWNDLGISVLGFGPM